MRIITLMMFAMLLMAPLGCQGGWNPFERSDEPAGEEQAAAAETSQEPRDEPSQTMAKEGQAVAADEPTMPIVAIDTSMGTIIVQLYAEKAPATVENFLRYVDEGFYDGTIFHRVKEGFMIQGGGLTPELKRKETHGPIRNEADNGLKNERGTIAMARTGDPHSATSQFFINQVDNPVLNFRSRTQAGYGYCVFGRVIEGMDVVDAIAAVPTTTRQGRGDVPVETIMIKSVRRRESK